MSSVADRIDLEDVKQPPLEAVRMRRQSYRHLDEDICQGHEPFGKRELYYSFSQYIANEVPPHYRQYYISYDACKDLLRYLDAANEAFQKGIKCHSTIPLKVRKMLNDSLQGLLAAHASSIDEGTVRALVPQVVFSDVIRQQLDKVNGFSAVQYSRIETAIRDACRIVRDLIATDKARIEYQQKCLTDRDVESSAPSFYPESNSSPKIGKSATGFFQSSTIPSSGNERPPGQTFPSFTEEQRSSSHQSSTMTSRTHDENGLTLGREPPINMPPGVELSNSSTLLQHDSSFSSSPKSSSIPTISSSNFKVAMPEAEYQQWRNVELKSLEDILDAQAAEIIHLDMFSRLNYKGFIRLAGLFDKVMKTTILPWISANVLRELFANVDIDRLLIFLSVAWDKYRTALKREYATDATTWAPPESFVRSTTKYWIRPDQVVKTKLAILKHMPYLIFGYSSNDLEAYVDPFVTLTASASSGCLPAVPTMSVGAPEESQLVSSIYFDSPVRAYSYGRRILRLEGAELVRFRWYGSNEGEPNKQIFIERKTHHESWTGESSTKERFVLPQRKAFEFMKGKLDIEEWAKRGSEKSKKLSSEKKIVNMIKLGHQIQDLIMREQLQPMVRTSYLRAAFQLATSNDVRFSLDTSLCMVDEMIPYGHPTEPWCRVGEEICGKDQVVRFPYSVLEVKLQAPQPPWVSNILVDVGAVMVYKFSKFQHGMAFLHGPLVRHLGVPHWIPEFESQGGAGSPPGDSTSETGRRYTLESISLSSGTKQEHVSLPEASSTWSLVKSSLVSWFGGTPQHTTFSEELLYSSPLEPCAPEQPSPSIDTIMSVGFKDTTTYGGFGFRKVSVNGHLIDPKDFPKKTLEWMKPISDTLARDDVLRLVYMKSKNIRKIDPKSYFAAERTFLHYIQKAVYLAALAIALLSFGGKRSQSAGVILGSVSLVILGYSFHVYNERSNRLDRRMTKAPSEDRERLDSKWGPVVIFAVVAATIVFAIGANLLNHHFEISKHVKPIRPRSHSHTPAMLTSSLISSFNNKFQRNGMQIPLSENARNTGLRGILNAVLGTGSLI